MLAISSKVSDGYAGVVLKRMFYRVANAVAQKLKISAIVTGEALGQVSSQTLKNLQVIEETIDIPVLRPLIAADKEEIIHTAQRIGTATFSAKVQEFCGIMGKKPTIAAQREQLAIEEAKLDIDVLINNAIKAIEVFEMRELLKTNLEEATRIEIKLTEELDADKHLVVDIRDNETVDLNPVDFNVSSINIPFFNLEEQFETLPKDKEIVLYCAKGLLSRIQAHNLIEKGHTNISILSSNYFKK